MWHNSKGQGLGEATECVDYEAERDTYHFFTDSAIDHICQTLNSISSLTVLRDREYFNDRGQLEDPGIAMQ